MILASGLAAAGQPFCTHHVFRQPLCALSSSRYQALHSASIMRFRSIYEDGGSKQQEYDECRKRVIRALLQINYLDCSGI